MSFFGVNGHYRRNGTQKRQMDGADDNQKNDAYHDPVRLEMRATPQHRILRMGSLMTTTIKIILKGGYGRSIIK